MTQEHEVFVLQKAFHDLGALSYDLHLMCPKVSEDDDEEYEDLEEAGEIGIEEKKKRTEAAAARLDTVYRCSLVLGFGADGGAGELLTVFKNRVNSLLETCAGCVRGWHRKRKPFLKDLIEYVFIRPHCCIRVSLRTTQKLTRYVTRTHSDEVVLAMEQKLNQFDAERITSGLQKAQDFIQSYPGDIDQKTFVQTGHIELLIALYEALCCMKYLDNPEHRPKFTYVFESVQQRRPLKLGEVLPTMTYFLFDDDRTRYAFAKTSWSRQPTVTPDDFAWAVKDDLQHALNAVAGVNVPSRPVQQFWEGLCMILHSLPKDYFVDMIGSLDAQPSIYQTMLNHMAIISESNLAAVLKVFNIILCKGPRGLSNTFANFSPVSVAQQVFASPAYRPLLAQTRQFAISMPEDDYQKGPVAIAWVKPFLDSVIVGQKGDTCDSIMHHFLEDIAKDSSMPGEGREVCYRGAAEALLATLSAFLQPTFKINPSSSTIHTNAVLNLTLKYKDMLAGMAGERSVGREQSQLSQVALAVIGQSLLLDSKVTAEEFSAYITSDDRVQREVTRNSAGLWEAALSILHPGLIPLARNMLSASVVLQQAEIFLPKKKERLSKPKEAFNAELTKTNEAIGKMMDKLSEFSLPDLAELFANPLTVQPIVASLINGAPVVHEAGVAFIKAATDEDSRTDAILKLLERHFASALTSFAKAVTIVVSSRKSLWSPQIQIHKCSKDLLTALCDPASGILRSRTLDLGEQMAVKAWWKSQWEFIEHALNDLDGWSRLVDTETMKNFCRDVMELADSLMAQDGLLSSALGDAQSAMASLLEEPRIRSIGLAKMLRLKDRHLVSTTVNSLVKLFGRLAENELDVTEVTRLYVRGCCTRNALGKFETSTNLDDRQRAELMRALGEDEDEIQIVDVKKAEAPKRQSNLDAWSKSAGSEGGLPTQGKITMGQLSIRDDMRDLTPGLDKHKSKLDQMRARHAAKVPSKPVAKAPPPKFDPAMAAKARENRLRENELKKKRDAEAIARAKALRTPKQINPGEGSGLQGLSGILGKDHAPQKSEIMVGSSSEDEEDSEDDAAFQAQTNAGKQRAEDASKRVQQLKKQMLGPVKKVKIQRSAKDMRARLIPPMDVLHKSILDWDIFHEGADPPNCIPCSRVLTTYQDPASYKNLFFPLLLSEAWRSFVTAKDETTSKPFGIKVQNRMSVNKFFEVSTIMPLDNKDNRVSEGDIILLSASAQPLDAQDDAHCLARIWSTKVKNGSLEVSYRLSDRAGPMLRLLVPQAEVYAVKITNMTTIEREYAALESLQYYDLMPEILEAKPSPMLTYSEEAVKKVMANYQLNPGQAKAILNAKDNDAFTLIQGPPGTGKTKTIVAMVGALLTGSFPAATGTVIKKPGAPATAGKQGLSKKLLVCAPSNAAVDELVLRLKEGVKTSNGTFHKINVLRLGRTDAINSAVRDMTLDEQVRARVEGDKAQNKGPSERQQWHEEAGRIKQEIAELRPQLESAKAMDEYHRTQTLQRQMNDLMARRNQLGKRIDADKDSGNTYARENEIRKRQVQQEILDQAQVLCATLSGSGHEMFKNLNVEFETVIIDEAAQCVELSALIPLKYGCSKCILVGDPKQLPPTVLSQSAARYGYDQSLFVRMQQNHPDYVHLLDTQYRMHPEISQFPSQEFYERRLYDGDDMAKLRAQPWHQRGLLGPYRFFDVKGSQERGRKGQSLVNTAEQKVAMHLYDRFKADAPRVEMKGKIGIITPYKAQLFALKDGFTHRYGEGILEEIEFNTTDAFQGRECEIIIFSCVRASPTGGIGFMTDIRRMNVGLTRAKSSLWILGDSRALAQGEYWNKLIENAKARDRYTTGDIVGQLRVPGVYLPPPTFSEYKAPPSALPAAEPRDVKVGPVPEDVDMPDAPVSQLASMSSTSLPQPPPTQAPIDRKPPPANVYNRGGPGPVAYNGINERGEPVYKPRDPDQPPVIHSSAPKRPHEGGTDDAPPAKKVSV